MNPKSISARFIAPHWPGSYRNTATKAYPWHAEYSTLPDGYSSPTRTAHAGHMRFISLFSDSYDMRPLLARHLINNSDNQ
jgi:hypothetical protein